MADFVAIAPGKLDADTLNNLLQEFTSRDGTDYGLRETPLEERVDVLRRRLEQGIAQLLFDADSECWDIVDAETARDLLAGN